MAENSVPMQIFDERLRSLRRARARKRMSRHGISFLLNRCLDDLAERLQDINRQFEQAILVGPFDLRQELAKRLPPERQIKHIQFTEHLGDLSKSASQPGLIISLLDLQSENNLPNDLSHAALTLKPDGVFIAAVFGGETLTELRQAFYQTDEAIFKGLSAHIFPMITHSQAGQLLSHAGLNLPVIDIDRFTVNYSNLSHLIKDLRDLGETNILSARTDKYLGKLYLKNLEKNYNQLFSDRGKLRTQFEVLWLTGWSPHDSQQKPLKPGSARMHLSEALGAHKIK